VTEPNKTRGVAGEYFCKLSEFYAPIYIAALSSRSCAFFKSYTHSFFMGMKEQQRIKVFMPARMMNSRTFKFAALFLSYFLPCKILLMMLLPNMPILPPRIP